MKKTENSKPIPTNSEITSKALYFGLSIIRPNFIDATEKASIQDEFTTFNSEKK